MKQNIKHPFIYFLSNKLTNRSFLKVVFFTFIKSTLDCKTIKIVLHYKMIF